MKCIKKYMMLKFVDIYNSSPTIFSYSNHNTYLNNGIYSIQNSRYKNLDQ